MENPEGVPAVDNDVLSELANSVSEEVGILFAAGGFDDTLKSLVDLAVATIVGCDYAGIMLLEGGIVTVPAHTDPIVVEIDLLQQRFGEGPCLDAIAHRTVFYAADLTTDPRWPSFSREAAASGIRSVLALPISADSQLGAVNLYAIFPAAFSVFDRANATMLTSMASIALSVANLHDDEARRTLDFQTALRSRETIGEALGILMERERISSDQSFAILRRASQHLNIKLREVALRLVETGEDPDTGPLRNR